MREVLKNKHQSIWLTLVTDEYENNKPATRADFDAAMAGYEAAADYPASVCPESLIAAYPEAKLVLSIRDEDGWHKSVSQTIWHKLNMDDPNIPKPLGALASKYFEHGMGADFPSEGKQKFREHNDRVRAAAKKAGRALLEFDVKSGWGPLCEFLGVEAPEGEFPRSDIWVAYKQKFAGEQQS